MITIEEILAGLKGKITADQEQRIRLLFDKIHNAYESSGSAGVSSVLEEHWRRIESDFDGKMAQLKKATGVY